MNYFKLIPIFIFTSLCYSQSEENYYNIIDSVSENKIESNIKKLVSFGTRHTLSDTTSVTTGIGAARRWIKKSFENISSDCNNCLEVFYQKNYFVKNKRRLIKDVWINNVVAIQRGLVNPNRYIIMSGDIDSRVSDPNDYTSLSPGANDNASGMAGVIEAARVLSKYEFDNSIIYVGLSGEEQGLYGGAGLANFAKKNNIFAGIHNGTPEYAQKMIDKGFNFVTIGADQRALSSGAKAVVDKMKGSSKKVESKAY